MSKETAFYPRLRTMTDQWMDLFGYWAPSVVTDTNAEYRACREAAALMDFTMLRKVDITGPGALDFVNRIVTRDISKLAPRRIGYGALCDEHGKMVDDCTVMVRSPESIRFCGANDRDYQIFRDQAPAGVTVTEVTDATPHLCLQGPLSRAMLQPLTEQDLSNAAFPYYTFREDVELKGIPVFMTRLGYTAELGYEIWVARQRALELWDVLVHDLAPQGMEVIGMTALDLFRIEGGFIIGGVEYDASVSPYECGLGWSVALDKADFQGRDGLIRDRDATRVRLTSVTLESGGEEASGARLFVDDAEVGYITQAVESPLLGKTLALAKLTDTFNVPGVRVVARIGHNAVPGEVVEHPVYDKERRRAKEIA